MPDKSLPARAEEALDDCWKRIGVYGDKSCERLPEHIHCRNCEVHARAAVHLLDRYGELHGDMLDEPGEAIVDGRSLLLFRLGEEWLALATRSLVEVIARAPIRSLPHQRSRSLLGVTNVRGTLVACLSLSALLGLPTSAREDARALSRMLIVSAAGGPLVAPVDEVGGIQLFAGEHIRPASREGGEEIGQLAAGVLQWNGNSVTLLDDELLAQAMGRSLA